MFDKFNSIHKCYLVHYMVRKNKNHFDSPRFSQPDSTLRKPSEMNLSKSFKNQIKLARVNSMCSPVAEESQF